MKSDETPRRLCITMMSFFARQVASISNRFSKEALSWLPYINRNFSRKIIQQAKLHRETEDDDDGHFGLGFHYSEHRGIPRMPAGNSNFARERRYGAFRSGQWYGSIQGLQRRYLGPVDGFGGSHWKSERRPCCASIWQWKLQVL